MVAPERSSSTPLGRSRSLRLAEPKNSLTPPSHSISSHLCSADLLLSWKTWQAPSGFGHTAWVPAPPTKEKGSGALKGRPWPCAWSFAPLLAPFQWASWKTSWCPRRENSSWRLGDQPLVPIAPWLRDKHGQFEESTPTEIPRSSPCLYDPFPPPPPYCIIL